MSNEYNIPKYSIVFTIPFNCKKSDLSESDFGNNTKSLNATKLVELNSQNDLNVSDEFKIVGLSYPNNLAINWISLKLYRIL